MGRRSRERMGRQGHNLGSGTRPGLPHRDGAGMRRSLQSEMSGEALVRSQSSTASFVSSANC